jgi:hypothetical protein
LLKRHQAQVLLSQPLRSLSNSDDDGDDEGDDVTVSLIDLRTKNRAVTQIDVDNNLSDFVKDRLLLARCLALLKAEKPNLAKQLLG